LFNDLANLWVELIIENWLIRGGCLRVYIDMVELSLKPCETLES